MRRFARRLWSEVEELVMWAGAVASLASAVSGPLVIVAGADKHPDVAAWGCLVGAAGWAVILSVVGLVAHEWLVALWRETE